MLKSNRRFVIGLGSQKCGTSWLHDYIARQPQFARGKLKAKELRIWDRVEDSELWGRRRSILTSFGRRVRPIARMHRNPEYYFRYFDDIIESSQISADITPSYCSLGNKTLLRLQDAFCERDIAPKFVFIMRDPVSRCKSAFDMHYNNLSTRGPIEGVTYHPSIDISFQNYYEGQHCRTFTSYHLTIDRMLKSLKRENCLFLFYETMFYPQNIEKISDFLKIKFDQDSGNVRVFSGIKKSYISECALSACKKEYAHVYAAVQKQFPKVSDIWNMP